MTLIQPNNPLKDLDEKLNDNIDEMLPRKSLLNPETNPEDQQENKLLIVTD